MGRHHAQVDRRGRLDDHPAVRQERLHPEPADARPQDPRGRARLAAPARLDQGPDPHRLPEHDLLRERGLRNPAGRAHLLPRGRAVPAASSGRASRRDPGGSGPVRPGHEPGGGEGAPSARAHGHARAGKDHADGVSPGERGAAPATAGRAPPRTAGARAVLRQLRQEPAHREVRGRTRVRWRPQGSNHHRPEDAEARPDRDRADPAQPERARGGARRDRSTDRGGQGDVRGKELP